MIPRRAGENTTLEARAEAHETVDKNLRYKQIIECFIDEENFIKAYPTASYTKGLTAKRIAAMMHKKGYIPTDERNFTAPRITELCQMGIVEPIGKKKCAYTGKTVTAYALTHREVNE